MSNVTMGTSGWSYKEWEGVLYPKGEKRKLAYYSKYFKTVEIDSTYYAYPAKAMVQGFASATPEDFVFSAKLPKLITHDKKLSLEKGVRQDLMRFLHVMRPLEEAGKLGALLIQLPPSFSLERDLTSLESFLEVIPSELQFAVEFRNLSWLRPETWDLLRKHNVANTIVDEPLLPPDSIVTADFSFIRWHGQGGRPWYNYRYSDRELATWVPKVTEVASKVKKVYGYHNNHPFGHAVESALKEMELLGIASDEQKSLQARVTRAIDLRLKQSMAQDQEVLDIGGPRR
ncbi:MAG: DUF72 domain-containing protein [Nitrososphaerales archaeon]